MTALKFPYTMHCPKCKAKLKIKSPEMVGKRMPCPKCKMRIDVITPDEDGWVPYGVEAAPEPEPEKELSEEEIEAIEDEERKKRKEKNWKNTKHVFSIFVYIGILCGIGWGLWEYVFKDYNAKAAAKEKRRGEDDKGDLFGKVFNVEK
jgi:hypothetical protein